MQVYQDQIDGNLWHRVVPETNQEKEQAEKFLTPDSTGAFLDMGNPESWNNFIKIN